MSDSNIIPKSDHQNDNFNFPKIFEIEPKKLTSSVEDLPKNRISDGTEKEKMNRSLREEADDVIINEAQLNHPFSDF